MKAISRFALVGLIAVSSVFVASTNAFAYGGPGSLISGVGALLAVLAAVVASIFGFLWFPVKRLVRKIRGRTEETARGSTKPADELVSE